MQLVVTLVLLCRGLQATSKFGDSLRDQVEEQLQFYDSGKAPRRNIDVMHGVFVELAQEQGEAAGGVDVPATGINFANKFKSAMVRRR